MELQQSIASYGYLPDIHILWKWSCLISNLDKYRNTCEIIVVQSNNGNQESLNRTIHGSHFCFKSLTFIIAYRGECVVSINSKNVAWTTLTKEELGMHTVVANLPGGDLACCGVRATASDWWPGCRVGVLGSACTLDSCCCCCDACCCCCCLLSMSLAPGKPKWRVKWDVMWWCYESSQEAETDATDLAVIFYWTQ